MGGGFIEFLFNGGEQPRQQRAIRPIRIRAAATSPSRRSRRAAR